MSTDLINVFNSKVQKYYAARTGILVNIQNIGKNTDLLAVREQEDLQEIKPGVWHRKGSVSFPDANFSNVYDLFWNPHQIGIVPAIHSSSKSYSLYNKVKRDTSVISAINGSFYFLTDIAESKPLDLPYDFCIRNTKVVGLPSSDEPILYIQDEQLKTKEIKAQGTIRIAGETVSWVGAKSKVEKSRRTATLYNSKCAVIMRVRDKKTNVQIGILDNENIRTPNSENVYDIVIVKNKSGDLQVKKVNMGGGTHFYDGHFILQMTGNPLQWKVGDHVQPLLLDGLDLQSITSGITIGKKVDDPYYLETERGDIRDARSIIAQDTNGYIHFVVFDGSKYIPGFNGVSAKELAPLFPRNNYKWAYFLDGGGSSRLIIREHRKLKVLANQFSFIKQKNGMFLWDWRRSRKIASSISICTIQN